MPFSDTSYNLRIVLDTHNCTLSAGTISHFERGLESLRKPVAKFPVSDLYITVTFHSRTGAYRVKTALVLSGRTLVGSDIDRYSYAAFERCVRKLVRRLETYQAEMSAESQRAKHSKGTHQEVLPEQAPDGEALAEAVQQGDYAAFRIATLVYEEPVRKRIGRWVTRYPAIEQRIGEDWTLADMVDEVFLNAFEHWDSRPKEVPLGEWLQQLIDPSIKLLAEHPDEELENIDFARTLREL